MDDNERARVSLDQLSDQCITGALMDARRALELHGISTTEDVLRTCVAVGFRAGCYFATGGRQRLRDLGFTLND